MNIKKQKKINNTILNAINYILKTNYQLNEYDINKIDKKFFVESEKLLPKNNYVGLSITQGNVYRKKEWPLNNIVELCNKLIQNNKTPVFFIEKNNHELINKIKNMVPSALFPEYETNFSSSALVTCLGKRLDYVVSIDNGVMHMLSLSKVPMIVLFGPTDSGKFAPDYKNSIVLDSKKLHNTKNVSSITVEEVLNAAKQHLNY
jgi:ADP-heptose:LPS heptosyltransferase